MSININDGFLVQAPKPADIKMYVGDNPLYEYATKEDIPEEMRFKGMIVYQCIADTYRAYRLQNGIEDTDFYPYGITVLSSIAELEALSGDSDVVFVSDALRGGIFVYDDTQSSTNNSGTILNGWVRQYNGDVFLSWFGDTTLEETWLNAASVDGYVQVERGTYAITTEDEDLSSYSFYSAGEVTVTGQSTISVVDMSDVTSGSSSTSAYSIDESDELLKDKAPLVSPNFSGTVSGITKAMVGLTNVDDTSDATKNAAVATLTNKTLASPVINSPTGIVKADVGLGSVDNTADADKPISTLTQAALNLKAPVAIPITTIYASTYTLLETDQDLSVTYTSAGACSITIPVAQNVAGRTIYIADDGDNAAANNITIYDDAGTPNLLFTINEDSNVFMLRYNGSEWRLR